MSITTTGFFSSSCSRSSATVGAADGAFVGARVGAKVMFKALGVRLLWAFATWGPWLTARRPRRPKSKKRLLPARNFIVGVEAVKVVVAVLCVRVQCGCGSVA